MKTLGKNMFYNISKCFFVADIFCSFKLSKLNNFAGGNVDFRSCLAPEKSLFCHDLPALYAQYVKNLSIKEFSLQLDVSLVDSFTNAIQTSNYNTVNINKFSGSAYLGKASLTAIMLINGKGFNSDVDKKFIQIKP
jgi:hypothetical protein